MKNKTYSFSVLTKHLRTSSLILAFLCENPGCNFSNSCCGVKTFLSSNFKIKSWAFSRTVSFASPNLSMTLGSIVCRYGRKSVPNLSIRYVSISIPLMATWNRKSKLLFWKYTIGCQNWHYNVFGCNYKGTKSCLRL